MGQSQDRRSFHAENRIENSETSQDFAPCILAFENTSPCLHAARADTLAREIFKAILGKHAGEGGPIEASQCDFPTDDR